MGILQSLDSVIGDRVLVFGSLPPNGRDIDLLARPSEYEAISALLQERGFLRDGETWVAFRQCTADAIELVASESWKLPPEEVQALFADGRPLEGFPSLVRPAPHHVLLIAARRLAQTGDFSDKQREKVEAVQAEDTNSWRAAAERSASWGADAALHLLRRTLDGGPQARNEERIRPVFPRTRGWHTRARSTFLRVLRAVGLRRRRGILVSISGCDGAGKSSQAQALLAALEKGGVDAVVVWRPLGNFRFLNLLTEPTKKILSFLRLGPFRRQPEGVEAQTMMSTRSDSSNLAGAIVKNVWVTIIAFLNGISQRRAVLPQLRRGRVVILDRSSLDAIVLIRFLYGSGHGFRFQRWLLRRLSPRSSLGYFLDVFPETLLTRKLDWWNLSDLRSQTRIYKEESARFGACRLDGELPKEQLCTTIATETWLRVKAADRESRT